MTSTDISVHGPAETVPRSSFHYRISDQCETRRYFIRATDLSGMNERFGHVSTCQLVSDAVYKAVERFT